MKTQINFSINVELMISTLDTLTIFYDFFSSEMSLIYR